MKAYFKKRTMVVLVLCMILSLFSVFPASATPATTPATGTLTLITGASFANLDIELVAGKTNYEIETPMAPKLGVKSVPQNEGDIVTVTINGEAASATASNNATMNAVPNDVNTVVIHVKNTDYDITYTITTTKTPAREVQFLNEVLAAAGDSASMFANMYKARFLALPNNYKAMVLQAELFDVEWAETPGPLTISSGSASQNNNVVEIQNNVYTYDLEIPMFANTIQVTQKPWSNDSATVTFDFDGKALEFSTAVPMSETAGVLKIKVVTKDYSTDYTINIKKTIAREISYINSVVNALVEQGDDDTTQMMVAMMSGRYARLPDEAKLQITHKNLFEAVLAPTTDVDETSTTATTVTPTNLDNSPATGEALPIVMVVALMGAMALVVMTKKIPLTNK